MKLYKSSYTDKDGKKIKADSWRTDFIDHTETRQRWPLGIKNRKTAQAIADKMEAVISHKVGGQQLSRELNEWIETACPQDLRQRMAAIGLIAAERAAGGRGLSELIDAFGQWIENQGNTRKQAQQQKTRVKRVLITECRFVTFTDIDAGRVSKALAVMRTGPDAISSRTVNFHLQACQQFCRWAVRNKLTTANPIEHLTPMKRDKSEERKRRALTAQEAARLLNVTAGQPERFNMSGGVRALLYRVALETGLRASELASLTASDIDLEGLTVRVSAANTKNRKAAELPLKPDTAELLRVHLGGKLPTAKAFDMPDKPYKMIQADYQAAGIDPSDDGSGKLDFHALRHSFGSLLAASGVHPKLAQELMRHSDINLTMSRYSHTYRGQLSQAINALPDFTNPGHGQESQRMTGTDDSPTTDAIGQNTLDVTLDVKQLDLCKITEKPGENKGQTKSGELLRNVSFQAKNEVFENPPGRTRICDLRFRKPRTQNANDGNNKDLSQTQNTPLDVTLDVNSQNDPELQRIIDQWPTLSKAIKAAMLAIVGSQGDE